MHFHLYITWSECIKVHCTIKSFSPLFYLVCLSLKPVPLLSLWLEKCSLDFPSNRSFGKLAWPLNKVTGLVHWQKFLLGIKPMWENNIGSGKTGQMCRLAWTFAVHVIIAPLIKVELYWICLVLPSFLPLTYQINFHRTLLKNCKGYKVETWFTHTQWVDVSCILESGARAHNSCSYIPC